MAIFKADEKTFRRIQERQSVDRWGASYLASIRATPKEAPGISTASVLRPGKLGFRQFHVLSDNELKFALLALYHPHCWEIHEQKELPTRPRPHYLTGHPLSEGRIFPAFSGTVEIADRIKCLHRHPIVKIQSRDSMGGLSTSYLAFPLIGDLLLFMRDEQGVYVVNWSIKDKEEDFRRKGGLRRLRALSEVPADSIRLRHEFERQCYAEADIATHFLAGKKFPKQLFWNLRALFLLADQPVPVSAAQRNYAYHLIRECIGTDVPAFKVRDALCKEFRLTVDQARDLMHQGVWEREIRLDLHRPFLMDRPLMPESVDILESSKRIFSRMTKA